MATPSVPRWLSSSKVSSREIEKIYYTLAERESARRQLRKASREVEVPQRFQHLEPKRNSLKKILKTGSDSGPADELSSPQEFYAVRVSSTPTNQNRNRYSDIEPYDRNRVLVGSLDGSSGRYLNASWVREVEGGAWWIAAQAPLFKTTHAFLSLFTPLQPELLRPTTIVQLTPIVEGGVRKADQYIPTKPSTEGLVFYPEEERSDLPPIEVILNSQKFIAEADCVVRNITLKLHSKPTPETVEIKHIDYEGWPDHSIPTNSDEVIHLIQAAQDSNAGSTPNSPRPIVCHCSAGVGRTGTFIALSSLLRAYGFLPPVPQSVAENFPLKHLFPLANGSPLGPLASPLVDDPVAREVDGLREQRTTMVQRKEQFQIIFQVLVNTYATRQAAGGQVTA